MTNYTLVVGYGFPTVECHAVGDPEVYSNLVWDNGDPIPSQPILDAWAAANTSQLNTITIPAQPYDSIIDSISNISTNVTGNIKIVNGVATVDTNVYLTGNQTITLSGDITGSGTTTIATTLSNTGVTPGTYQAVTVDATGRVSSGSNPSTISGYGITDAQPLDADLTALAALATTGIAVRTAADTWTSRAIVGGNVTVTNGDGIAGNPTINLSTTGIAAGTYDSVTVDEYGRATAGTTTSGGISIKAFYTGSIASMTGTGKIPATTATPLITGGTQIWTTTITPTSATSKFVINFTTTIDAAASQVMAFALFRGTTCIAVCAGQSVHCQTLTMYYVDTPATTAATTYSLRAGTGATTTWYIGREATATYGGKGSAVWTITEI